MNYATTDDKKTMEYLAFLAHYHCVHQNQDFEVLHSCRLLIDGIRQNANTLTEKTASKLMKTAIGFVNSAFVKQIHERQRCDEGFIQSVIDILAANGCELAEDVVLYGGFIGITGNGLTEPVSLVFWYDGAERALKFA